MLHASLKDLSLNMCDTILLSVDIIAAARWLPRYTDDSMIEAEALQLKSCPLMMMLPQPRAEHDAAAAGLGASHT